MGRQSDVFWDDDGPEYDPDSERAERMRRLAREELKTRVLVNNNGMLADILAEFERGWTKQ